MRDGRWREKQVPNQQLRAFSSQNRGGRGLGATKGHDFHTAGKGVATVLAGGITENGLCGTKDSARKQGELTAAFAYRSAPGAAVQTALARHLHLLGLKGKKKNHNPNLSPH